MRRLSHVVLLVIYTSMVNAQEVSPHGESGPEDCKACHIAGDWWTLTDPLLFDHDTTNFPLNGGHESVDCMACHNTLIFSEASLECASCHTDIHSGTVGRDCARCHSEESWLVDHIPELHELNGFPLVGAHSTLNCADCHNSEVNLRFDRIGNDCINCHMADYLATTDPNHIASGFSTECAECHDVFAMDWTAQSINHDFFPLIGGHDIRSCNECHLTETFSDASPECISCHQDDFVTTTNPDHQDLQFSTDCNECHTIRAWAPAEYAHEQFPLLGEHQEVSCNECHQGNYINTPNTCVGCHLDDYNATTNPDHAVAQFPQDCTECHDENGWEPSTFDHDGQYFPIYSGNHRNEWTLCTECHIEPTNYAIFSCIDCHEHGNKNDVDDDHDDVNGYVYESNACLRCHPDGRE